MGEVTCSNGCQRRAFLEPALLSSSHLYVITHPVGGPHKEAPQADATFYKVAPPADAAFYRFPPDRF